MLVSESQTRLPRRAKADWRDLFYFLKRGTLSADSSRGRQDYATASLAGFFIIMTSSALPPHSHSGVINGIYVKWLEGALWEAQLDYEGRRYFSMKPFIEECGLNSARRLGDTEVLLRFAQQL